MISLSIWTSLYPCLPDEHLILCKRAGPELEIQEASTCSTNMSWRGPDMTTTPGVPIIHAKELCASANLLAMSSSMSF